MTNRRLCKKVLEEHFKIPFKRTTINGSVIDFFNKDLKIGLVYNSIHHYIYSQKFHKTYCKFIADKGRDEIRWETCRDAGIKLVTIPNSIECFPGRIRRSLAIPNDCRCLSCLYKQSSYK